MALIVTLFVVVLGVSVTLLPASSIRVSVVEFADIVVVPTNTLENAFWLE